jgi:anti-sigma regulatory factor (Ser/Thr protein kinase)
VGATCLCAVYDPTTCTCVLASAGHPSPLLIGPDGTTRILDLPHNPPLSAGGTPFQSATVDMAPGSVLAMYTDGLLRTPEFRSGWDWQRVQDELGAGMREHRPLRKWCDGLMPAPTEATLSDDVAILLARTRRVDPGDVSHWQFRADPASVADARTLTERQLADWHLEHLAFTAELVISELITNAIRYAEGPVSLRLIRGRALICEVGDDSNTQPRLIRAAETDEGGRGLYIVAQCTSRWGCRYGQKGKTIWTELPLSGEEDRASHLVPS